MKGDNLTYTISRSDHKDMNRRVRLTERAMILKNVTCPDGVITEVKVVREHDDAWQQTFVIGHIWTITLDNGQTVEIKNRGDFEILPIKSSVEILNDTFKTINSYFGL